MAGGNVSGQKSDYQPDMKQTIGSVDTKNLSSQDALLGLASTQTKKNRRFRWKTAVQLVEKSFSGVCTPKLVPRPSWKGKWLYFGSFLPKHLSWGYRPTPHF